ncbi:ribosomal-protein-serine acetyltransferase [Roseivivax lentus]|uniref:Ribosomal-protein-serine acetyltransferase n=2 Tax=Roseivivax lentus TaxID=633194 RepID=A0A1N7NXX7_9RHOB|nr:ribosomal-protein-serine acetyltransferase [Roseivivax lentus]
MTSDETCIAAPFQPGDTLAYLDAVARSFPDLARTTAWAGSAFDAQPRLVWAQSRAGAWAAGSEFSFALKSRDGHAFLGVCGLGRIDWTHRCGNLSFWTATGQTRRGVATCGARAVISFGFTQLGLARIEILTAVDNIATCRVAEKLGATKEGVLAARLMISGKRRDAALYAMTAPPA